MRVGNPLNSGTAIGGHERREFWIIVAIIMLAPEQMNGLMGKVCVETWVTPRDRGKGASNIDETAIATASRDLPVLSKLFQDGHIADWNPTTRSLLIGA